ncbi:hypothetical protein BJF86_06995 [Serinicoccus sp. CNJ-927]|uniref:DUF4097 family beta strand repeat-containing protein n=1 Tax=Serinicoccus sp. CNJ-927 TaxID=1904970 RepID=UPI0009672A73|nr:DUF4097 family beta strand repeat-containing protein [Serinicoccus sp. CNJ-927]OLT39598.1 hypothetical protein BJF86_06995 [Serinicoccus sp. CNJ-927]
MTGQQPARTSARGIRTSRGGYTGLRVVGGVVTAVLVGGATVSSVPSMLRQSDTAALTLPHGLDRVIIQSPRGDVDVREAREGEQARVEADLHWSLAKPELGLLRDSPDDGSVVVQAPCSGGNLGQCAAGFSVTIPPGTDVEVTGGFGDIDVTTTGAVSASGTGGDMTINGEPSRVELDSTMGDVTIEGLGEPPELVRVTSTMGDVTVTLPGEVSYAVTTSTDMGADPRVTVDRASDSPYVVDLETTMGSIEVLTPESASSG